MEVQVCLRVSFGIVETFLRAADTFSEVRQLIFGNPLGGQSGKLSFEHFTSLEKMLKVSLIQGQKNRTGAATRS